ncbi:MAG TPA: hypothetical protein VLG47_07535 [Candidatus Saccharimonadales bacterium]|nr:hypothetical protein [Candidatus Saccharimonadales bacterium]
MNGIFPIVSGETAALRAAVEAVFTPESAAVDDRLQQLEAQIRALGYEATFGMEIEAVASPALVDNPHLVNQFNSVFFYERAVEDIIGASIEGQRTWDKGAAILPEQNPGPIMVQGSNVTVGGISIRYNLEDQSFFEIQTAPANACTAVERYWRVIQAIGQVAERYGGLAAILSTHVSTGFRQIGKDELVNLWTPEGARLIAAVQYLLNRMDPLQFHSGMQTGYRITEAYPSKHASSAWHEFLFEQRHPTTGVADPRIDMLCSLSGAEQFARSLTPLEVLRNIHECVKYSTITEPWDVDNGLGRLLSNGIALWDTVVQSFVLPRAIQSNAVHARDERRIDALTQIVSNGAEQSFVGDNGQTLRKFVGQLCLERHNVRPRPGVTLPPELITILQQLTAVTDGKTGTRYRYLPRVEKDSPTIQPQRHHYITSTPTVKAALGPISSHLTPPEQAIALREDFVSTYTYQVNP